MSCAILILKNLTKKKEKRNSSLIFSKMLALLLRDHRFCYYEPNYVFKLPIHHYKELFLMSRRCKILKK